MRRIPELFLRPFPHWDKIDFFRRLLYVFLLINALSLLPIIHELFSYDGIIGSTGWNTKYPWYKQGSKALLNVLSHPLNKTYPWVAYVFVFGQIGALISGLLSFLPRLSAVLIYFFSVNLFLKGYLAFTGGETLINLLLFYLIFIQKVKEEEKGQFSLQNLLNNTFYSIMLIQICVLYFMSNLYKLIDPIWLNGEAMYYISQVDAFSSGLMRGVFENSPIWSTIVTYLVLIYQGVFPILVWIKRFKIPFLLCGVVLHLAIAFGMGIFAFGMVMILVYVLFLSEEQIQKLKHWLLFKRFFKGESD